MSQIDPVPRQEGPGLDVDAVARGLAELEHAIAERDRYREALETITHWWLGHDPEPWRPDIVAYKALHNVGPAEAMERLRQEHHRV